MYICKDWDNYSEACVLHNVSEYVFVRLQFTLAAGVGGGGVAGGGAGVVLLQHQYW